MGIVPGPRGRLTSWGKPNGLGLLVHLDSVQSMQSNRYFFFFFFAVFLPAFLAAFFLATVCPP